MLISATSASPVPAQALDSNESEAVNNSNLLMGEKMFHSRDLKGTRAAFEMVLKSDSQNAQAHYFLGLVEYEEGNVEKAKTRFQIAHECVDGLMGSWAHEPIDLPDAKQVQLEFPDGYEARIYYKDGWYVKPKNVGSPKASPVKKKESDVGSPAQASAYAGAARKSVYSLEAGSSYRIEVKSGKTLWIRRSVIGLFVALSFFLAR